MNLRFAVRVQLVVAVLLQLAAGIGTVVVTVRNFSSSAVYFFFKAVVLLLHFTVSVWVTTHSRSRFDTSAMLRLSETLVWFLQQPSYDFVQRSYVAISN